MAKKKFWTAPSRNNNFTFYSYGERDDQGIIDPAGAVTVAPDGERPRWVSSGDSKGTADDVPQAMLAVETFVRLKEEGKL